MVSQDSLLHVDSFTAVTLGIIVLFLGKRLNEKVNLLREFSIPESVSGGLFLSLLFFILFLVTGYSIDFDLSARDTLLVYFFTTIGINASFSELRKGGKPLLLLLGITIAYMVVQNLTGIGVATLFGLEPQVGVIGGTMSLIGGHGTAIAWAPRVAEQYGIKDAMELGVACATFGLILASLMGGPIAKYLIKKHKLSTPSQTATPCDQNQAESAQQVQVNSEDSYAQISSSRSVKENGKTIDHFDFLDAILAIHLAGIVGISLHGSLSQIGFELPLFVTCLFGGMLITNMIPKNFPTFTGRKWPTRSPAISLIADVCLGTFLAMSLMSMKLWDLLELAGPVFAIMGMQFLVAVLVVIWVVFPVMGRNYDAAVICSGFGGISLGATPTAMANMSAVSERYGPSTVAFIIVPLVCAFFIDIANAFMIPYFLNAF